VIIAQTKEEAKELLLKEIKEQKSIAWSGSASLQELGIKEAIRKRNMVILDRDHARDSEDKHNIHIASFGCDYYLMGTNAITRDGKLVNMDGLGNRLAAMIYGPDKVYVIAGINKICDSEEEAIQRVRQYAAPANAARLHRNTPCAQTGICHDCLDDECICSHLVITRRSWHKERITIVLVNEDLGI